MIKLSSLLFATLMLAGPPPLAAQGGSAPARASAARPVAPAKLLNDAERAGYAAVFADIRASNWQGAASRLDALGDGPLQVVARAELYLAKGSPKVALEPLLALLAKNSDMPQAVQLAKLAEARGADDLPELPRAQRLVWNDGQPRRGRAKSVKGDAAAAELESRVQPLIRDNQPSAAELLLTERETLLSPEALTEYRQRIGWSYYIVGDDVSARRLADRARIGGGEWALPAEWLAGLAAWRMRDCAAAGKSFANVAARATDTELAAAGHYWAARADMLCGRPEHIQGRLRTAARMSETFYGLLAQSRLAMTPTANRELHDYRDAEWHAIGGRANVKAAVALVEIGESDLAEELIKHEARINPAAHGHLVHLVSDLNLPATQLWLAHNVPGGTKVNMAARYPAPDWKPTRGWRVDRPLVFAHTLQESGFRTKVVSPAGATGLMQVRPGTAGDMARARGDTFSARQLTEPAANIEYGQSYLEYLRDLRETGGLLPKVIAAYNAGPVPVAEWNLREFDRGDPLLYIESIPYWETRAYVPTILRNYWIYEQSAGRQGSTSRDALVQELWPRFPGMSGATAVRVKPRNYAATQQGTGSQ